MGIICVPFAERIVRYVESLVAEIIFIDDTVCVVARLPDFAREFLADGEREAALDELSAALDGLVGCWVRRTWTWSGMTAKAWRWNFPESR